MGNLLPKRFNAWKRKLTFLKKKKFWRVLFRGFVTPLRELSETAGFIHRNLTLRGINRPLPSLLRSYQKNFRDDIFVCLRSCEKKFGRGGISGNFIAMVIKHRFMYARERADLFLILPFIPFSASSFRSSLARTTRQHLVSLWFSMFNRTYLTRSSRSSSQTAKDKFVV